MSVLLLEVPVIWAILLLLFEVMERELGSLCAGHVVAQLCDAKPRLMNVTVAGFASGRVFSSMVS